MLINLSDFFRSFYYFKERIILLMSRDIRSRFGKSVLSYVISLSAPLVWITITVLSFQLLSRKLTVFTDVISFVIAGILPYLLFRYTITAVMRTKSFYTSVSMLPSVKRWHVNLALAMVELINAVIVYLVVSVINYSVFSQWEISRPTGILNGLMMAWLLGLSVGYLCDALSERFSLVAKVVPVVLRPMFLISAVFYTGNEIPYSVSDLLTWNPLLHITEIMREGMFDSYVSFHGNALYPGLFSLSLLLAGLLFRHLNSSNGC